MNIELPIITFLNRKELRRWLTDNHMTSKGAYVRIYKTQSGVRSVTFEEVLDEGLCFGWSENKRLSGDESSYLQRFTSRTAKGTSSLRNIQRIRFLPSAQLLAQSIVVLIISLLMFTRIEPFIDGMMLVAFISYIFIFLIRVLWVIDKPFRVDEYSMDDVSLFLLQETDERIKPASSKAAET